MCVLWVEVLLSECIQCYQHSTVPAPLQYFRMLKVVIIWEDTQYFLERDAGDSVGIPSILRDSISLESHTGGNTQSVFSALPKKVPSGTLHFGYLEIKVIVGVSKYYEITGVLEIYDHSLVACK